MFLIELVWKAKSHPIIHMILDLILVEIIPEISVVPLYFILCSTISDFVHGRLVTLHNAYAFPTSCLFLDWACITIFKSYLLLWEVWWTCDQRVYCLIHKIQLHPYCMCLFFKLFVWSYSFFFLFIRYILYLMNSFLLESSKKQAKRCAYY